MSNLTIEDRALIQRALGIYSGRVVADGDHLSDEAVVEEMCAIRQAQNNLTRDQVEAAE
jgi:hypothetical protein